MSRAGIGIGVGSSGSSGYLRRLRGGIGLHGRASLEKGGVVALATLADLESIILSTLDIVTRGPGEGAILGLSGNNLNILQVGGGSFAKSKSDGLNVATRVSDCIHPIHNKQNHVPGPEHHLPMSE